MQTDEIQHYAAFHLGLHCLPKYSFRGFRNTKDLIYFTLCTPMEFSIKLIQLSQDGPLYVMRATCYNFQFNIVFHFMRISFVLANRAVPDEMQYPVAFHLGIQYLQKYLFSSFKSSKC